VDFDVAKNPRMLQNCAPSPGEGSTPAGWEIIFRFYFQIILGESP